MNTIRLITHNILLLSRTYSVLMVQIANRPFCPDREWTRYKLILVLLSAVKMHNILSCAWYVIITLKAFVRWLMGPSNRHYILTSFWVLRTPESWLKHFFGHFQACLYIFNVFQGFYIKNQEKSLKKQCLKLLFVCLDRLLGARYCISWPANGCSSFSHISYHDKMSENDKKVFWPDFKCT